MANRMLYKYFVYRNNVEMLFVNMTPGDLSVSLSMRGKGLVGRGRVHVAKAIIKNRC